MTGWFWRRLGREDARADVEREIAFHLEMRTREFEAQGMSETAAREAARASFGDRQAISLACQEERRERTRQRRRAELWRGLAGDARVALRSLRRSPVFSLSVILTLGLGVGLVTATAGFVNAYLVRALPYPEPDRLVFVNGPGSPDWRSAPTVLQRVAAWDLDALSIVSGGRPERVWSSWVTPGFFAVLGVKPALGRLFTNAEAGPGGAPVAVISHALWQRRWNGSRDVLGQTFSAYSDDRPNEAEVFTIVGVLPADFWYFNRFTEILAPLRTERQVSLAALAPGATPADAQRVLSELARQRDPRADVRVVPVREQFTERVRPILTAVAGAVALVLLLACGNAATLLLVRATGRRREFAIRAAIGAGRGRMARQLLTEGLTLSLGAALVGALSGWFILELCGALFERVAGTPIPGGLESLRIDGTALGVTIAASTVAALIFALIPHLATSRINLVGFLISARAGDSLQRQRARSILVGVQIALSLALLIAAGLLVRSASYLQQLPLGFDTHNLMAMEVSLRQSSFESAEARAAFYERAALRVRERVPGVQAAFTLFAPFSRINAQVVETPEHFADSTSARAAVGTVSPEYFDLMGIRMQSGVAFSSAQRASTLPIAVISQSLARRLWPNQVALGRRLRVAPEQGDTDTTSVWRTVVGVTADVRKTLTEENLPDLYVPIAQAPFVIAELVVRDPTGRARIEQVREAVWSLNAEMPLNAVRWLEDDLRAASLPSRFLAILLAAFACFAVLLAAFGLYGVVSYAVLQRRRDIAIRMALGARRESVVRLFLQQGARVTAAGLLFGLAGGYALSRLLRGLLYGVTPGDITTYLAVSLLLAGATLLATWLPARRAVRADPMHVLKEL